MIDDTTIQPRPVHLERPGPAFDPAPVLLLAIDRGPLGVVRIQRRIKAGRHLVDVRLFERRGRTLYPTDRGIALRLGELAEVLRVLQAEHDASTDDTARREHR
jgi:hypothetical protein